MKIDHRCSSCPFVYVPSRRMGISSLFSACMDVGHALSSPRKIATVGIYGAKKVVAFAKAFIKARKEAPEDAAGEVTSATKDDDGDEDDQEEGGDEKAVEVSEPRTTNHVAFRFRFLLHRDAQEREERPVWSKAMRLPRPSLGCAFICTC